MTVNCQTFDQTSSQTGWSGQDAETGTAYASGTQATYTVQSSLSTNTTYYWRSYAIDPGGSNTWSATQGAPFSFTTTNAPAKPTACVLQKAPDDSSVTITWNDIATNEDGYRVERDTDGGGFSLLQSLPADSESHEDSTVTSGHTYQYRVAAFFTDGPVYSDWCTTATIDMGSGTFNFDGLNMQGVTLD